MPTFTRITGLLAAATAVGAVALTPELNAQAVPAAVFYVRNNSAVDLTCSVRRDDAAWSSWQRLARGQPWERADGGAARYAIRCRSPARAVTYPLERGQRYAWLRSQQGAEVRLFRVAAGH